MMRAAAPGRIGYFGKIPARSDFIKLADDISLMGVLDDWLAEVMSRLPANARWKIDYDALAPVSFAFVGPRRRHAIAGHVVASRDQSGRRFPFLMVRTLEVANPATFVSHCPLVLEPLWTYFETMAPRVLRADDPAPHLHAIAEAAVPLDEDRGAALAAFLGAGTVGSLGTLLERADAHQLILALGLLLQPVTQSRSADVEKSLVLPLPEDPAARYPVAAFWLELVIPFLRRADVDLALFVTRVERRPALVVGLFGAAAQALHAIVDPLAASAQQVRFADTGWVGEQAGSDVGIRALASYLDQPQLPLTLARELFLKTFIGARP